MTFYAHDGRQSGWTQGGRQYESEFSSLGGNLQSMAGSYGNGLYQVVRLNADQAGWGSKVPAGYEKVAYMGTDDDRDDQQEGTALLRRIGGTPSASAPAPVAASPPPPPQFQPSPQLQALNKQDDEVRQQAKDLAAAWQRGEGRIRYDLGDAPTTVANEGKGKVNDYEFRFLPSKRLQSAREALEIGEATRHNTARLPGDLKLPENLDANRLSSLMQSLKSSLG